MNRRDPRHRRRLDGPGDALAAAHRLEVAADELRAATRDQHTPEPPPVFSSEQRPAPLDEDPPTGLLDLAAVRAMLDLEDAGRADPAALAWLRGGPAPEPAPAEVLAVDVVTAAQLGTVEPPVTAAAFAAALGPVPSVLEAFLAADAAAGRSEPTEADLIAAGVYDDQPEPEPEPEPERLPQLIECRGCGGVDPTGASHIVGERKCCPDCDHRPVEVFSSEQRPVGWRSRHDARSRLFGVRDRLAGRAPLTDRMWPVGGVLDQGAEGACVGMAVANAAASMGMTGADTAGTALELYQRARELDTLPGEDYTGTSVLAGLQAATEAGLFGGYLWAFGTRDIAEALLRVGPVVVGVRWLSGMGETGPAGLVTLTGDDTGMGHALSLVGLKLKGPQGQAGPFFVWENSWGPDYGDGGLGYVHHRDLSALLAGIGEAAIPTRDRQVPA